MLCAPLPSSSLSVPVAAFHKSSVFPTFKINADQNYPKPRFQEGVDFHRTKHFSFISVLVNYINSFKIFFFDDFVHVYNLS